MNQRNTKRNDRGFGLLTPMRQRAWLNGVASRCEGGSQQRQQMVARHAEQDRELQQLHHERRDSELNQCRIQRRQMLDRWDQSDERLIADYESQTIKARDTKHRELASLRRQQKRALAETERKLRDQRAKLRQQHDADQPKAAAYESQQNRQIDEILGQAEGIMAQIRQLVVSRLGDREGLLADPGAGASATEAGSAADAAAAEQAAEADAQRLESLEPCLSELRQQVDRLRNGLAGLTGSTPAKLIETYWLVVLCLAAAVTWCAGVYLLAPGRMALWMLGCLPFAILVGAVVRIVAGSPLRRATEERLPAIQQDYQRCEHLARVGRYWVSARAGKQARQLRQKHRRATDHVHQQYATERSQLESQFHQAIQEATEQHDQQLRTIETSFRDQYATTGRELFEEAERTALQLSQRLADCDSRLQTETEATQTRHRNDLDQHAARIDQALERAVRRAAQARQRIEQRFPLWADVFDGPLTQRLVLPWLPLGTLPTDLILQDSWQDRDEALPPSIPLMLTRRCQAAVLVDCAPEQMPMAVDWMHGVLWRALTAVAPGRVRLTLLDPSGHGQNFSSLVAMGDHDPQLITHRAWSSPSQITARLQELTQHVEDVLQACLRDRYDQIESYNAQAGALAEPYRVVAAVGLPAGLTPDAVQALRSLIDGGRRCGIFLILLRDSSQPWPGELPALPLTNVMHLRLEPSGRMQWQDGSDRPLTLIPASPPPAARLPGLADAIGRAAIEADRVEIPLAQCLTPDEIDRGDSAFGLTIPVGRQGVRRSLQIDLGKGMRQHVLVAGKTGSGKSTLLHAMITAGAMRYSPDQLHLYLLDFKKGVEFKMYADAGLPHARVIGIESEREFGRSVLQRLDEELQSRGEAFRAAGVQELAEFRHRSSDPLPRILLIVDEFQELFVRDDRVAQDCTMYLDRLVRQGRSFGIHVVLSSQSLAGAHSLPRATLGQMAIRVALQCSESDAALILSDDNTAARLLSRPGEAIFNDAGGLVEGNQPFQVAWIDPQWHREQLASIAKRHSDALARYGPPTVFEGNRPARWSTTLAEAAVFQPSSGQDPQHEVAAGLLGEAVRIGPPVRLAVQDGTGRNGLAVADAETLMNVFGVWISSVVVDALQRGRQPPRVVLFDGQRSGDVDASLTDWLGAAGIEALTVRPRDAEAQMIELAQQVTAGLDSHPTTPTIVVIHPLERFRDLRQDDGYGFSLDAGQSATAAGALQTLLRDGPQAHFHTLLGCAGAETLARWLPRSSQHDLEMRIVGRVSATDSAQLIDTPDAGSLSPATLILYDDADGSMDKFRLCQLPPPDQVRRWIDQHRAR